MDDKMIRGVREVEEHSREVEQLQCSLSFKGRKGGWMGGLEIEKCFFFFFFYGNSYYK